MTLGKARSGLADSGTYIYILRMCVYIYIYITYSMYICLLGHVQILAFCRDSSFF